MQPELQNCRVVIVNKHIYEGEMLQQIVLQLGVPLDRITLYRKLHRQYVRTINSCDLLILEYSLYRYSQNSNRPFFTLPDNAALLFISADTHDQQVMELLSRDESDCVGYFWHEYEATGRIKQLLIGHILKKSLQGEVEQKTKQLADTLEELTLRLAEAIEGRDLGTGRHAKRISRYAEALGRAYVAQPNPQDREALSLENLPALRRAALLHDIGKLAIADSILKKRGRLTDSEKAIMNSHTTRGANILKGSELADLQAAFQVALTHHEKWDSSGYPQGLQAEGIPLMGRIVAIADVFDALTKRRRYQTNPPIEPRQMILDMRNSKQWSGHFDPYLLDLFAKIEEEVLALFNRGRRHETNSP